MHILVGGGTNLNRVSQMRNILQRNTRQGERRPRPDRDRDWRVLP